VLTDIVSYNAPRGNKLWTNIDMNPLNVRVAAWNQLCYVAIRVCMRQGFPACATLWWANLLL